MNVHDFCIRHGLEEGDRLYIENNYGTIVECDEIYKIKFKPKKQTKIKIHSTFEIFIESFGKVNEFKIIKKDKITDNNEKSIKKRSNSYKLYQEKYKIRKEEIEIFKLNKNNLNKKIEKEFLNLKEKYIKGNTIIKDSITNKIVLAVFKNVISKEILENLKNSTINLPFHKKYKKKRFIIGLLLYWIVVNYEYFNLINNLLLNNFPEIHSNLNNLNFPLTFGSYPSIAINKGNIKKIHLDSCDVINGLSVSTVFGHNKGGGLKLSQFNRTVVMEEGDVVFFNGRELWHDIEESIGDRHSVILYSHESYYKKDKTIYTMTRGQCDKLEGIVVGKKKNK
ncbi:hypothetical protein ABK040_003777 [Willaertia magna]